MARRRCLVLLAALAALVLGLVAAEPVAAATTHDVTIESFVFSPGDVHVAVGDTVRWTNNDGVAHNVSGGPMASGNFATGTYSHTFGDPGTFSYLCTLHSGMTGQVVVSELPPAVVPEASNPAVLVAMGLALAALAFASRRALARAR